MVGALPWPGVDGDQQELAPLPASDLRAALSDARIHTHYQPIVRMADRRPVALEVLARLQHPDLGMLLPGRFIPPMEAAGLGCALTEAVLLRAFDEWSGERLDALDMMLAFNFPLEVLLLPDALTHFDTVRMEAGVAARRVVIELTESSPLTALNRLEQATHWLRGIGYSIAIDDVSPEMRDHRALLDLPFTALKLDKKLVGDALDDPFSGEFLADAIAAAAAAGMTVTAEGVEDEVTWRGMQALGVDLAQGFLISRALPAAAVLPWHREWCSRFAVAE